MMRALLLTFTLVVLPGVLRCVPSPARFVVSHRHSFDQVHLGPGNPHVHPGYNQPVRTLDVQTDFLVMLPLRTGARNFVSIFDWRLKQFLCVDLNEELYHSRKQNSEDCHFQRVWVDVKDHRHVLLSSSSGLLLRLQAPEALRGSLGLQEGHHRSLTLPQGLHDHTLLSSLVARLLRRRHRRSGLITPVDPSDPLRSEPHHPHPALPQDHHHQGAGGAVVGGTGGGAGGGGGAGAPLTPEQEQPGAVSKETIATCDDPLKVLQQPNPPVSPVKNNFNMAADEAPRS